MGFVRGVFIFAFIMLVAGIFGGKYLVSSLFGTGNDPYSTAHSVAAQAPTPVITPVVAQARPTATVHVIVITAPPATTTPRASVTATTTPTAAVSRTATASPTPTHTAGPVVLARYWVGEPSARPGTTISIGYVIDNQTGHTAHVMLGASIKSERYLTWAASLSDPTHDVVAIVPPGVSTHERFFTLPAGLRPGTYDVAWGLRDAESGRRDALNAATAALRIER